MQKKHQWLLASYTESTQAGTDLSGDQIASQSHELERQHKAEIEKRVESSQRVQRVTSKDPYTDPLFGTRYLSKDPKNKKLILDLSGLIQQHVGFDPTEPVTDEEARARQIRAEKEHFSKAKAQGKYPNPQLCWMCREFKTLKPYENGFTWGDKQEFWPFGNWFQLVGSRWCSICGLTQSLVACDQANCIINPRLAMIDRDVAGISRRVCKLSTGEMALWLEYGMQHIGELRIITPDNYHTALRQGWEAKNESLLFSETVGVDEGPIYSKNGQTVSYRLLKRWINNCDHNHGQLCHGYRGRGPRYAVDVPMMFIDVVNRCLVKASSAEKYFALSYVWGSCDMSSTFKSNVNSRLAKGGLPSKLPATISDAVQLVLSLGEKYLWVDAFCIVQDDTEHKQHDIERMDIIYSRAFATIVALHGSSAEAGLPGIRVGTRPPQEIQSIPIFTGSEDLDYHPGIKPTEYVHVVATPRQLHLVLGASIWNTRGWILQEHLLSRRCLFFTDQSIYFQCGQQVVSEWGAAEVPQKSGPMGQYEVKETVSTAFAALENPIYNLPSITDLNPQSRLVKTFTAYSQLVERYTKRKFTYETDVLNAFSGMFAVLDEYFEGDILNGLPTGALDLALL